VGDLVSGWRFYFPEDGESVEDATVWRPKWDWQRALPDDAQHVAERACEIDFSDRDGWERGEDAAFKIVVIAPNDAETVFTGRHVPSVDHQVSEGWDE
jgi:hypothetical protein